MTFKARGIIFDTMFLESDPEHVFTDHNTQMAIMIALEPYSHESSEKQKNYSPVLQKQGFLFHGFFTNNSTCWQPCWILYL